MEEFVKAIAEYGIIGLVAALALVGFFQERKANSGLRDRLEANEKAHGEALVKRETQCVAELSAQAAKFAGVAVELQKIHAEAVKLAATEHREQEDELVERLLGVTEKVAVLVDSIERKRGG